MQDFNVRWYVANEEPTKPSDLFSSAEARAMLEEFRALVRAGVLRVTPENEILAVGGQPGGGPGGAGASRLSRDEEVRLLDKQLLEWFERKREQRVEAEAAERRTAAAVSSIRQAVIERLSGKILEQWEQADRQSPSGHTLREQVIARLVGEVLGRWQPDLE